MGRRKTTNQPPSPAPKKPPEIKVDEEIYLQPNETAKDKIQSGETVGKAISREIGRILNSDPYLVETLLASNGFINELSEYHKKKPEKINERIEEIRSKGLSVLNEAEQRIALAWTIAGDIGEIENCGIKLYEPSGTIILKIIEEGSNINFQFGLALAKRLNTFFSAFLKPEVLTLGSLETKLISHKNPEERHNYIYSNESNGRIIVFGSFPSFTHIHTRENCVVHSEESSEIVKTDSSKERYHQLKNPHIPSKEFYVLRAVLDFCFSNFVSYSIEQRLCILENVIKFFECKTSFRQLHFFQGPIFPPTIANFMFSFKKGLIYLDFPTHDYSYLEIYNPILYEELFKFFIDGQGRDADFTGGETSIDFVKNLKEVMQLEDTIENKLRILYSKITDPTLRKMFCNCVRKDLGIGLCKG